MNRKTTFFEGWSWFKFNNLELVGMALKKVKKVFIEVTGGKLVGRVWLFAPPHSPLPFWIGLTTTTRKNVNTSSIEKFLKIESWLPLIGFFYIFTETFKFYKFHCLILNKEQMFKQKWLTKKTEIKLLLPCNKFYGKTCWFLV